MNEIILRSRRDSLLPTWFQQENEAFNMLHEELDQFFNRMMRADLQETEDELVIAVDLPGFEEKDVDVALSGDRLTIKGHIEHEEEKKEGDYHFSERRVGNVSRMVTLPCEVEADKVDAKMKNGVLTVTLPKSTASKSRTKRIKVKRAG